ncbi:MAG: M20/M25/M40 family metallo-hydrolase [Bryobacterales bacterium]|nr:M20/M25/M40 family metallo-hydrolase [Bryobacterales bacterium]
MRRYPLLLLMFAVSCTKPDGTSDALGRITAEGLLAHIRVLASDEFEGRAPATKGEELSVDYITAAFKKAGLKPGNPDGTFVQKVPLVGLKSASTVSMMAGGKPFNVSLKDDMVVVSRRFSPSVKVENSDVVFVGYGVVAPEYGWDDYKGVDVKGKTIVMLVNDPAVPDPNDPTKLDERTFKGRAMTYYGRWTYKYEIASEKGAAAAIIVHETGPAGYPFSVVQGFGRENFEIQRPDKNAARVAVESWISFEKATALFAASGQDLAVLKKAALGRDFKPIDLKARASFSVTNTMREVYSKNVVAKLEGSSKKDEYVVYTAHWDHLGRDETMKGDQISNGAIDNASGVACLLELANAFSKLAASPKRSILFLAVTAEEKGLLGAKYYAENPLYPLKNTVADINMDAMNQWGRTKDIVLVGLGNSTLDDVVAAVAAEQGRTVKPDAEPEKGFFYRSDHFEFAKQGVPAIDPDSGTEFVGKPAGFSQKKRDEYTNNDYHKVSDEVKPDWDLSGAVEDTRLLFQVGYRVAETDKFPEWKPGTEFKARREAMLK